MIPFKTARFAISALSESLPEHIFSRHGQSLEEVAFVGRSNVGKSSLLNHLLQIKKLAHVSSKPGKTQTINFFITDESLALVDLPGYGFAKVPKSMKKLWAESIESYLKNRKQLKLLLILLDCRRIPSHEDLDLLKWAHFYQKPFVLVLTKYDKLKKNDRKKQISKIETAILEETGIKPNFCRYTNKNSHYRKPLIQMINESLNTNDSP